MIAAEVVDPEAPRARQPAVRAFFGATVRYANAAGEERLVSIVGTDEVDLNRNHISWVSPLGRALMKSAAIVASIRRRKLNAGAILACQRANYEDDLNDAPAKPSIVSVLLPAEQAIFE